MATYKFIKLLHWRNKLSKENPTTYPPISKKAEENLKKLYIVLKIEPTWHTKVTSQQKVSVAKKHKSAIILYTEQKKFGTAKYNINSSLTPEANSDEIKAEIKKFEALLYKRLSKYMYKNITGLTLRKYLEPFGNVENE